MRACEARARLGAGAEWLGARRGAAAPQQRRKAAHAGGADAAQKRAKQHAPDPSVSNRSNASRISCFCSSVSSNFFFSPALVAGLRYACGGRAGGGRGCETGWERVGREVGEVGKGGQRGGSSPLTRSVCVRFYFRAARRRERACPPRRRWLVFAQTMLKLAFAVPPGTLNRGGSIRCVWNNAGTLLAVCGNTGALRRGATQPRPRLPALPPQPPPRRPPSRRCGPHIRSLRRADCGGAAGVPCAVPVPGLGPNRRGATHTLCRPRRG